MTRLSDRLYQIRLERYGEHGAPLLAEELGLSLRAWSDYEHGATIPEQVLFNFIDQLGISLDWVLTGEGEPYETTGRFSQGASVGPAIRSKRMA